VQRYNPPYVSAPPIFDPELKISAKSRSIPGLLLQTFLIYAIGAFLAFIVRSFRQDSGDSWASTLALQGFMVLAAWISINRDSIPSSETGLKLPGFRHVPMGSVLGVIFLNMALNVVLLSGRFPPMPYSYRSFPVNLFWIGAFVPVAEEFFVRGWFQTASYRVLGETRKKQVIVLSAATFAVLHAGWILRGAPISTTLMVVLGTFLCGLFFARSRQQSGSIFPPIFLHAIYNLAGILFSAVISWITAE